MEQLCKNCQHWERYINKNDNRFPLGEHHYGGCSSEKFIDHSYEMENDSFSVANYESDHTFLPGENFGCIHFENKLAQVTEKL